MSNSKWRLIYNACLQSQLVLPIVSMYSCKNVFSSKTFCIKAYLLHHSTKPTEHFIASCRPFNGNFKLSGFVKELKEAALTKRVLKSVTFTSSYCCKAVHEWCFPSFHNRFTLDLQMLVCCVKISAGIFPFRLEILSRSIDFLLRFVRHVWFINNSASCLNASSLWLAKPINNDTSECPQFTNSWLDVFKRLKFVQCSQSASVIFVIGQSTLRDRKRYD